MNSQRKMKDIWKFKFVGKRNQICYTEESIRHPAKMELNMCREIIKKYSKKGELILDPMAGIGTTIIEGMLLGRNVIGIEYEQKFVDMTQANIKKTNEKCAFIKSLGKGQIIKGDSRKLSELLNKEVDKIMFSPPFAKAQQGCGIAKKGHFTDPKLKDRVYGEETSKSEIEQLDYGKIDGVIMSPPYGLGKEGVGHNDKDDYSKRVERMKKAGYSDDYIQKNFKNTPGKNVALKDYSSDNDNIGRMSYKFDTIVTSPPFETMTMEKPPSDKWKGPDFSKQKYSDDKNNKDQLGNLKGKNYLTEMLKIYQECFKVLKQGGYMILVLKNFVRKGEQVRLDLDTIKLCETAKFKLIKRHYRKITNPSFWITNAIQKFEKKYPGKEHPYPLEEDILVFKK